MPRQGGEVASSEGECEKSKRATEGDMSVRMEAKTLNVTYSLYLSNLTLCYNHMMPGIICLSVFHSSQELACQFPELPPSSGVRLSNADFKGPFESLLPGVVRLMCLPRLSHTFSTASFRLPLCMFQFPKTHTRIVTTLKSAFRAHQTTALNQSPTDRI